MSEEFALCWNNFTENITSGFQSLLNRRELCDVTLAVEGKLFKAHKIVLSICSPYFQQMFMMNPHPNPIIIMAQDMKAKLVSNLLEFIYVGAVNVEQAELQEFMRIAEALQIKGLTTNSKEISNKTREADVSVDEAKKGFKRRLNSDEKLETVKLKETKPCTDITDLTADDTDMSAEDQFQIIPMPEISIVESRTDTINSKSQDSADAQLPTCSLKISAAQSLNKFCSFDFNNESVQDSPNKNLSGITEVVNEVSESGSGITMLSSTSLLHGSCVFNRNNTVATQAGLKTYWLCKSYRISMCKARCITFKGRVISATGIHNHLPHMSNKPSEIPPGHTPNVFIPSQIPELSLNSITTSSSFLHHANSQQIQQPYNFLQYSTNQQQPIPDESEISHFKMEHT